MTNSNNSVTNNYRLEKDSLGEMKIPVDAYYGIQTERARQNFSVSDETHYDAPHYIWAVACIKKAAARANLKCGVLDSKIAAAIETAADEVMSGRFSDQFPICVYQGGGGTSTNMNVNEVLANRANEILTGSKGYSSVHPNDHVNLGQSTNDVIPAAMKIACYMNLRNLQKKVATLYDSISVKSKEFAGIVKLGRTCLQDAVPIMLGQQFSGYSALFIRCNSQINGLSKQLLELPLGATAVGTALNTADGYIDAVYIELKDILQEDVCKEDNFFDGLQNADIYLDISTLLKKIGTGLSKFSTDLRLMSSGPRAGFNEINLPAVQPGSSIMPGKINPVMPELMNQLCYRICGNDTTIAMAVEGGEMDLNIWEPVLIKAISESTQLLSRGITLFIEKCINGITANETVCRSNAENSVALSAVIASLFDYDTGTKVAKTAFRENKTIKQVVIEMGLLSSADADKYLDPIVMTDPQAYRALFTN